MRTRSNSRPKSKPTCLGELPFVHWPGYKRKTSSNWRFRKFHSRTASHWRFPDATVYGRACEIGYECSAHFAQYLKDQPDWRCHGMLGKILTDIDFKDASPNLGYRVGFLSYLERLIRCAALDLDVFADVDDTYAYYEAKATRVGLDVAAADER